VLQEVMRLYPPIPIVARECVDENASLGEFSVPKGAYVFVPIAVLHKHPKLWKDPQVFDPDRFREPVDPFSFLPFGGGPRSCVGMNFAMLEAKCTLAVLLRRFDLSLTPNQVVIPVARLSLRPKYGLQMIVNVRPKHHLAAPQLSVSLKDEQGKQEERRGQLDKPLVVLFGSQSGMCETFARQLATEAVE
jgi:cytochrome P450